MLAPPNQGSEVADRIESLAALRWILPRLRRELITGPDGITHRLGPPPFTLGVIAGTRSFNPLFSAWLPHPDDGAVAVASTRLEGMADFTTVRCGHTWMMDQAEVTDRVARFLLEGCFAGERRGPARAEGLDTGRA
jgi:hypothetical protein